MPAVAPLAPHIGLIARHAVSQGYVEYVQNPQQSLQLDSTFREIQEVRITANIERTSDVLHLFSCTATIAGFGSGAGDNVEFRFRRGTVASPLVQSIGFDWNNSFWQSDVIMVWAWESVAAGQHIFRVDARLPTGTAPLSFLFGLLHVVVILKR